MTATYCTTGQVGESLGLGWADEDTVGSNSVTNTVFCATTVGRKYSADDTVRLFNSDGQTEDATVSAVTYGSSYTSLTVGSLTNASYFSTAKSATVQIRSYFTGTSNPTKSVVEDWINNSEDEINSYTRRAWGDLGSYTGYIRWEPRRTFIIGEPYSWYKVHIPYPDPVIPLTLARGDSLKVWDGGNETEFVGVKTEGRTDDFWFDGKSYLYINALRPWPENNTVKMTYHYGGRSTPKDIRRACILLTKAQFNESNLYTNSGLTEGESGEKYPYPQSTTAFRNTAYTLLKKRRGLIYG